MKSTVVILSMCALLLPQQVWAQAHSLVREGNVPSSVNAVASRTAEPLPNTPEWQLTLDVIKVKAGVLMDRNNLLTREFEGMVEEYKRQQLSIRDYEMKNEQLRRELAQKKGRSQQQITLDELTAQRKAKEQGLKETEKLLAARNDEIAAEEKKLELKQLKIQDLELARRKQLESGSVREALHKRALASSDKELEQLKEKMQFEQDQEELLKTQLLELRQNPQQVVSEQVTAEQLNVMEQQKESLRRKKEDLQKRLNVDNSQTQKQRYTALVKKKKDLEAKIRDFEDQLEQLKDPKALGVVVTKENKVLVRQLAQIDARNAQVRQQIAGLNENVMLLREQITRLERKITRKQDIKDINI